MIIADKKNPLTFEPVASEITPVTQGANTEELIPKKLKTPKVVP